VPFLLVHPVKDENIVHFNRKYGPQLKNKMSLTSRLWRLKNKNDEITSNYSSLITIQVSIAVCGVPFLKNSDPLIPNIRIL